MSGCGPRRGRTATMAVVLAVALAAPGCHRKQVSNEREPRPEGLPTVAPQRPAKQSDHPRMMLDDRLRARAKASAKKNTYLWRELKRGCDEFVTETVDSGYVGHQWGEAIADLTTCWLATDEARYRDRAVFYTRAMIYDKARVGDGAGGDEVIRGDSGYPIRTFAVYSALAYDWLHDAPGMDELRPVILDRLHAWISWYQERGYLRDSPTSNYFWGYFTALTLAGLATDGETDDAESWLAESKRLLDDVIIPAFWTKLKGGEWGEGWQYGPLVAQEVAWVIESYRTATGADYASSFPWLGEIVSAFQFRLMPGRNATYGNATHEQRPAPADSFALYASMLVLERTDKPAAARARFLARHLYPPLKHERAWFPFLADDPDGDEQDPRKADVLSYFLPGPGQTFMRSSWADDAVWVGFQAGPRVSVDHEHNDQGHLEIWRGKDPLLGDFGDGGAFATINHNSLLIDDGRKVLYYSPNQGIWGDKVKTIGPVDDGATVVAVGDIGDAWNPKCVEDGCDARAVRSVRRTLAFVRPDLVAVEDRVELTDGNSGVTWAGHTSSAPHIDGNRLIAVVGGSKLEVTALWPDNAKPRALKEPTPTADDGLYVVDMPYGNVWRSEIDTERGDVQRRLVTFLRADAAGAPPAPVRRLVGKGLSGGAGKAGSAAVAVVFAADGQGGTIELPTGTSRLVVAGLTVESSYAVTAAAAATGCTVTVGPAATGRASGAAGSLDLAIDGCVLH
jgi:hypothetical protein